MQAPVTVKIKFKSTSVDHFIDRYAADVSEGGIFIRTPRPLSVGTHVTFHFQLQDGSPLLSGDGTVVWVREQDPTQGVTAPGMGVRFDTLPPESRSVLDQVLDRKARNASFQDLPTRVASHSEQGLPSVIAEEPQIPDAMPIPDPTPRPPSGEMPALAGQMPPLAGQMPPPVQPMGTAGLADAMPSTPGPVATGGQVSAMPMPAPAPAPEQPAERSDRLEQLLFSEEEEHQGGQAESVGATPLAETGGADAGVAPSAAPAATRRKSSALGWLIILLLLVAVVAGAFVFYKDKLPKELTSLIGLDTAQQGATLPPADQAPPPPPPPPTVSMKIDSTPPGAKIIINGTDTGQVTPAEVADLVHGEDIEVTLDLPGRKLVRVSQQPTPRLPLSINLTEPATRTLRFESTPEGADVFFNGRKIGVTPTTYDGPLEATKSYKVRLRARGHAAFDTIVEPASAAWARDGDDEALIISATLEPQAIRRVPRTRRRPAPASNTPTAPAPPTRTEPEPEPDPDAVPEPDLSTKPTPAKPAPARKPTIRLPDWGD